MDNGVFLFFSDMAKKVAQTAKDGALALIDIPVAFHYSSHSSQKCSVWDTTVSRILERALWRSCDFLLGGAVEHADYWQHGRDLFICFPVFSFFFSTVVY